MAGAQQHRRTLFAPTAWERAAAAYRARVVADGGTVADFPLVLSTFKFIADNALSVHHWISPRFGLKTEGAGVRKLYCLYGKDIVSTVTTLPQLGLLNGKNVMSVATSPMDAVDSNLFNTQIGAANDSLESYALINVSAKASNAVWSKAANTASLGRQALLANTPNLQGLYSGGNATTAAVPATTDWSRGAWIQPGFDIDKPALKVRLRLGDVLKSEVSITNTLHTNLIKYVLFGYMNAAGTDYEPTLYYEGQFLELIRLNALTSTGTKTAIHALLTSRLA